MSPIFLNCIYFLLIPVLYLFRLLYQFTIGVYLKLRSYSNQGAHLKYGFGLQIYNSFMKDAILFGDSFYSLLEIKRKHPKLKAFAFNIGKKPLITLLEPSLIKEFLLKQENFKKYGRELSEGVMLRGTFLSEGEEWKASRRVLAIKFNSETLKEAVPMIVKTTLEMFDRWDKEKSFKHLATTMFYDLGGEICLRYFYGTSHLRIRWKDNRTLSSYIDNFFEDTDARTLSLPMLMFGPKFVKLGIFELDRRLMKNKRELREYVKYLLKDSLDNDYNKTSLATLHMNEQKKGTKYFDEEKMINELMELFIANADVLSHTLAMTLYYLHANPEKLKKVKEEVEKEIIDPCNITLENVNRMEYTYAALKETLRLFPEAAFLGARESLEDQHIGNIKVKKGDLVNFLMQAVHLNKELYTNPEDYCPERWLQDGLYPDDGWKKESHSFLSFLTGPRNCIGQYLGLIEGRIILGLFLKKYSYNIEDRYMLKKVQGFSYHPLDPIYITMAHNK